MPAVSVKVLLIERPELKVSAEGTRPDLGNPNQGPASLTKVVVELSGLPNEVLVAVSAASPLVIPEQFIDSSGGPSALQLQTASTELPPQHLELKYEAGAATTFLGVEIQSAAGIDAKLTIVLPKSGTPPVTPFLQLRVRSSIKVEAAAGGSVFTQAKVGLILVVDVLGDMPDLALGFLDNLRWPRLRNPWPGFPKLPKFPLRIPAGLIHFPDLPGSLGVSWKAITIDIVLADGSVTIAVEGLRVEGMAGAWIEATFTLLVYADRVALKDKKIATNFEELTNVSMSVKDECIACDWKGKSVNQFLALVAPEFRHDPFAAAMPFYLRVCMPGGRIDQIRFEIEPPATNPLDLSLPGILASIPAPRRYAVIVKTPASGNPGRVMLLASMLNADALTAKTTFACPCGTSSERCCRTAKEPTQSLS
jgi:hypothetical protein